MIKFYLYIYQFVFLLIIHRSYVSVEDGTNKVFTMSDNIVAVMAGQVKYCIIMCQSVKDKCSKFTQHDGMLTVSAVYEETIKYLQGPNGKDKIFGIIIAGWDNKVDLTYFSFIRFILIYICT